MLSLKISSLVACAILLLAEPAAAQSISLTFNPCPVEKITPKPADDMTQRLNDNEDCLWRTVKKLDQDAADLRSRADAQNTANDKLTQALRDQRAAADASLAASVQKTEREIATFNDRLDAEVADRKAAIDAKSQASPDAPSADFLRELERKVASLQNKASTESALIEQLQAQLKTFKPEPVHDDSHRRAGTTQGGIEIVPGSAFLSSQDAQLNAGFQLTNVTNEKLLAMVITSGSSFILEDAVTQSNIRSIGIFYCEVLIQSCLAVDDNEWTAIEANQMIPFQLSSTLNFHTQAKAAGLKLRMLIKSSKEKRPHDFSFMGIVINER